MYERFTEEAIKVITLAQEEARRLGVTRIGTEQLLLALVAEGSGIAAKVLSSLGISLDNARIEVEKVISLGREVAVDEAILYQPQVESIVIRALEEASQLGSEHIGTEHLLLSLIREEESVAASVLESMGVELSQLRTEVLRRLNE